MSLRFTATWTDARIGLLKQLRAEGVSCAQIAAALGQGISRSAVIGKIHRLALPPPERKRTKPQERVRPDRVARLPTAAPPRAPDITLDQFDAAIPIEQRRTLTQLTRSACRWPVGAPGQPEFFFCGGRVEEGRPYCTGHCGFAYQQEEGACRKSAPAIARPVARSSRISRRSARG